MPLTPEQIAKIRQKEAETPDALKRDPLSKYTEGWFHVTLNVRGEAPVLGFVTGSAEATDGTLDEPRCVLTELGKKVEEVWRTVTDFHPMCICDNVKAMPDHIHALLHLLPNNDEHLGRIINGLMIGSTHCYWDTLSIPWRRMRAEKDAQRLIMIKTRRCGRNGKIRITPAPSAGLRSLFMATTMWRPLTRTR